MFAGFGLLFPKQSTTSFLSAATNIPKAPVPNLPGAARIPTKKILYIYREKRASHGRGMTDTHTHGLGVNQKVGRRRRRYLPRRYYKREPLTGQQP